MFRQLAFLSVASAALMIAALASPPEAGAVGFGGYYVPTRPGINIGGFRPTSIHTGGFNSGGIHSSTISIPGVHTGGIQLSAQQRLSTPLAGGFSPSRPGIPTIGRPASPAAATSGVLIGGTYFLPAVSPAGGLPLVPGQVSSDQGVFVGPAAVGAASPATGGAARRGAGAPMPSLSPAPVAAAPTGANVPVSANVTGQAARGAFAPYGLPTDMGLRGVAVTHAPIGGGMRSAPPRRGLSTPVRSTLIRPGAAGAAPTVRPPQAGVNRIEAMRRTLAAQNVFSRTWLEAHPEAWRPPAEAGRSRMPAAWPQVADWLKIDAQPFSYDYGGQFVVRGGLLFHQGREVATLGEYAARAAQLAASGAEVDDSREGWLPLGDYGVVQPGQEEPAVMMQLWVSDQGQVAGTWHNSSNDETAPIRGAVDPTHQRVALTLPDGTIVDSGLYNLTEPSAAALAYSPQSGAQQWLLLHATSREAPQTP